MFRTTLIRKIERPSDETRNEFTLFPHWRTCRIFKTLSRALCTRRASTDKNPRLGQKFLRFMTNTRYDPDFKAETPETEAPCAACYTATPVTAAIHPRHCRYGVADFFPYPSRFDVHMYVCSFSNI